ncbi:MAG: DUF523 domain-containing protein [Clostridia bacterium]|nr:DUF523 domain-containing protein [Clostridia bacterium]
MKKALVSACLLGVPCRYDGLSKPVEKVIALKKEYELIPICPEVQGGLDTPRVPAEIVGDRVINKSGIDVTENYKNGAKIALDLALENGCKVAILKAKSPSCGKGMIYDGTFTKTLKNGNGVCAKLFLDNDIIVFTENEIGELNENHSK